MLRTVDLTNTFYYSVLRVTITTKPTISTFSQIRLRDIAAMQSYGSIKTGLNSPKPQIRTSVNFENLKRLNFFRTDFTVYTVDYFIRLQIIGTSYLRNQNISVESHLKCMTALYYYYDIIFYIIGYRNIRVVSLKSSG